MLLLLHKQLNRHDFLPIYIWDWQETQGSDYVYMSSYLFLHTVVLINGILIFRCSDSEQRGQSLSQVVTCFMNKHTITCQVQHRLWYNWNNLYSFYSKKPIGDISGFPSWGKTQQVMNVGLYPRQWRWPFSTFGTRNMDPRSVQTTIHDRRNGSNAKKKIYF